MTITSRGSSVSSAASACRIASRRTSTCRRRPWQAWISMLRSVAAGTIRSSGPSPTGAPGVGRSSRMSACSRPQQRLSERLGPLVVVAEHGGRSPRRVAASTSCISRASRPHEASSRLAASSAVGSSARLGLCGGSALRPSELIPQRWRGVQQKQVDVTVRRQRPQDLQLTGRQARQPEQRDPLGQLAPDPARRSAAHAPAARRSAGLGTAIRARSRRHSSACHAASGRSDAPAASWSSPPATPPASSAGASRSGRTASRGGRRR